MCLMDAPNDPLMRRSFKTALVLSSQYKKFHTHNGLVDSGCTGAHTVINEAIVPQVCELLGIEPVPLSKSKPLRGYDGKLSPKLITHCLFPNMEVNGHKEGTCPMLIAPLGSHDVIIGKPWMNKHKVLLDMMKDKILFVPGRCTHDDSAPSNIEDLTFISLSKSADPPVPPRPLSPTVTDSDSDDDDSVSGDKRVPKKDDDTLDICEIGGDAFFLNAKDENNKLFSLTMNEIYDIPPTSHYNHTPRVGRNERCPCQSGLKYKKCCGKVSHSEYGPSTVPLDGQVDINNTEADGSVSKQLTPEEIKQRLPTVYHDYLNVFNRSKADKLPPYRLYNHRLEFIDNADKSGLLKSRIYSMSGHKLKQIKKYLDEHLRKGFIVPSKAPFASPVLFAEKPNGELRFCVDYRRLNQITKRNRYPIPLVDEVLARLQGCRYLTRLDIIAAFNKLRMHPDSEDYTTFVTSLGAYKYRVLPFGLTNGPATYQQYMNDILFQYLNDFCQAYLDDILIYSKSKKEHITHVRLVLQKLRDAGLQVDIRKCEFHVKETRFLGLLVSVDGLRVDPAKVAAVLDWTSPSNLKEMQGFIGFCNFYRRFIKNFFKIVKPMVRLT